MKACITTAFRIGQGEKTIRNAAMPAQGILLAFHAAHPQIAQSVGINAGLMSPAIAHAAPAGTNLIRARYGVLAAANIPASNSADKLVSQIRTGAINIGGIKAHRNPAKFAVLSPKCNRAICKTRTTVINEKSSCKTTTAVAAAEPVPKTLITAARNSGYPGAMNAVGPDWEKNGELNPWPACNESAIAIFSNPQSVSGGTREKWNDTTAATILATTANTRIRRQRT